MIFLSADDLVCIFIVFVVWMRRPTGTTGTWVMLHLVYKWLPLWEFSLFDTSLGLGVLWHSRVLESALLLQRLRASSLARNEDSTGGLLWH